MNIQEVFRRGRGKILSPESIVQCHGVSKKNYRKFKRSGTERCPIKDTVGPLVEHHIRGHDVPDADAPWNVAWISPDAHDEVHSDPPKIIIEGWAMTTDGRQLLWHRAGEQPVTTDARPPLYGDAPR